MKKLILNMLLLFGITVTVAAQAYDAVPMAHTPANQIENNKLLFNPSQNVYATEIYRSYWVWDKTSVSWVKRVEVMTPALNTPAINADPLYKIPNQGYDVCYGDACLIKTKTKPGGQ